VFGTVVSAAFLLLIGAVAEVRGRLLGEHIHGAEAPT
jgi:hypothetical protein